MTSDTCNHWYHDRSDDRSVTYCRECKVIMAETRIFRGDIKIGKLAQNYNVPAVNDSLNIVSLIKDHLGVKPIITDISVYQPEDYSWERNLRVIFSLGSNNAMVAEITYTTGNDYVPTTNYYTVPEPVES